MVISGLFFLIDELSWDNEIIKILFNHLEFFIMFISTFKGYFYVNFYLSQ